MKKRIMTGATGFVGSHFLAHALGEGGHTSALVRAPSEDAASRRLERALSDVSFEAEAARSRDACRPVCFDLREPGCGISGAALRELKGARPNEFWHFAASLKYEDRHRDEIFGANVEGTRRALELARELGCEWFVYVSTAYTAATRRGDVPEALHAPDVPFNNCYEETKSQAEHAVQSFCRTNGLSFSILRPSIVIGPYSTKTTGGSTSGLYGFIRELLRARKPLRGLFRRAELCGDPETPGNLLPVDWFVEDVARLVSEGLRDGGVYHMTTEHALSVGEISEVIAEVIDIPGFEFVREPSPSRSPVEVLLERRLEFYGGYLSNGKRFLRSRPFSHRLSRGDVVEYVRRAVSESASARAPAAAGQALVRTG